ncbi:MAG: nucleotidyltransferase family protein, partial [Aquabacterium sp.]|nr:nucleotidyltransferase family protein [Aquabacterium sp.]
MAGATQRLGRLLAGIDDPRSIPLPDWETLLAQARVARLWPRLGERCAGAAHADLPPPVRQHLASGRQLGVAVRETMAAEVDRVADVLAGAGIRCVLLKGAAYLAADLPVARGRVFGDIDLLVPRADIGRAEQALLGGGWLCQGVDAYDMRYYRDWMHEIPPLTHVHRHSVLDLHHTITPPTSSFAVAGDRLLAHARCVDASRNLHVLQPVDQVLHSAVHLFSEGEFDHGLRDLLDLDDLLRDFAAQDPAFWPQLLARAGELGLQRPLHHALQSLVAQFGRQWPQAHAGQIAALRPAAVPAALMAWLLRHALKPLHASCRTPGDGLARWLLYVRSHWLRMPVHLLLPHLLRKAWMRRLADPPRP